MIGVIRRLLGALGARRHRPPPEREQPEAERVREQQREIAERLAVLEARVALRGHTEREGWR